MSGRRPTKQHALEKLIELGVPVGTVIDVGILKGTYDLMMAYKSTKQLLIEQIVEWNEAIRETYTKAGVDFELINVAASNTDGKMMLETSTVRPGQPITHARLTDKKQGQNLREVKVQKLDTIVSERPDIQRPFLLKLDVDGVEIQILEGARSILPDCSVLVIEANIKNFIERANWIVGAGFTLFDIVDICYYDGRLRQFDLVFINTKMMDERGLDMYKQPFDMSKWVNFT